jgi:hypothetical protein
MRRRVFESYDLLRLWRYQHRAVKRFERGRRVVLRPRRSADPTEVPDMRLLVVGSGAPPEIQRLDDGCHIAVCSDVPTPEPYYRPAIAAVVSPGWAEAPVCAC